MPAEWEPHEATWIGWPHNVTDWPGKFATIPWVYGEIVRKIAPGEKLRVLVNSAQHKAQAQRLLARIGVDPARVEFFRFPTNRGWTRDFGPVFVARDAGPANTAATASGMAGGRRLSAAFHKYDDDASGVRDSGFGVRRTNRRSPVFLCESRAPNPEPREIAIVRFRFNGWAKYPNWRLDDRVPERVAAALGYPLLPARAGDRDFVLEGGSIESNGRGTLVTTEECLLDPKTQVRNPGLSREEIEAALRDNLGVANVLWLGRGIAGDDTHGHVDDVCRFVDPRTVVLCRERNPRDPNYKALEENRERLEGMRLEDGSKIEVVALPMPAPLHFQGQRLPASYANFYISNAALLVPTFNDPNDRVALGALAELITDRPVIGIHAVDLAWGLGTLHCLTQQQPTRSG